MVRKLLLVPLILGALLAGSYLVYLYPRPAYKYALGYEDCDNPGDGDTLRAATDRSGFWVGAAVHSLDEPGVPQLDRHFNSVTFANALKWGELLRNGRLGEYDFTTADRMVEWAAQRGLRIRGHALVWGRDPGSGHPSDLAAAVEAADDSAFALRRAMREHITAVVGRYRDSVAVWDVVNEPLEIYGGEFADYVLYRVLGAEYVKHAFFLAAEADPQARLFLNEQLFDYTGEKAQALMALVEEMVREEIPIHGVGLQSHSMFDLADNAALENYIRRIGALGLAVELTEVDIPAVQFRWDDVPLRSQARAFGDLTAACAAVEACEGITFWGLSDGGSWLDELFPVSLRAPNRPLLFDAELRAKPAYCAVREELSARRK